MAWIRRFVNDVMNSRTIGYAMASLIVFLCRVVHNTADVLLFKIPVQVILQKYKRVIERRGKGK